MFGISFLLITLVIILIYLYISPASNFEIKYCAKETQEELKEVVLEVFYRQKDLFENITNIQFTDFRFDKYTGDWIIRFNGDDQFKHSTSITYFEAVVPCRYIQSLRYNILRRE